ncbi:MAG: ATP-binding protein [Clostridiaceae bacterium]|nr:ATP-binding protein [Clostridiaceae bacterium]
MQDFEKLGVFYLGKEYDLEEKRLKDELILYKSKDLTTHAVIIGMTGSGKTGLGIGIIEEAAIDNIPVIAIDPKGDLGNLALTFPQLRGEDFLPWVNVHEAANKGLSAEEYANNQAELWRKGLSEWGQDEKRIERLRNAADVRIYTPGGSAGLGVSLLRSFNAPPREIINDKDAYRDRVDITTNSLLSLLGFNADPFTSREYILISNIFEHTWSKGQNLDLPELISAIQKPPMDKIGVMDVDSFYPSKDRFSLAMMLNSLLASPGFKAWLEGDPMDINRFMYDKDGRPTVSIFSITHLSDSERMFFVTMLLNEVLSWVRSQPGTGSLRAILYMDELFGYLPPIANPPSKAPLLTLLKQARAYGLGLVLSTQNPGDLDYKALSNAGTWFIGRLQTERDKERVLAGLEGAAAAGKFDRARTEQILAGLGQRIFYLHSVHNDEPVIFSTRWVLSYLSGPLTRDQISSLTSAETVTEKVQTPYDNIPQKQDIDTLNENRTESSKSTPPVLPPQIKQVYLPATGMDPKNIVYVPSVIGAADVLYSNAKLGVSVSKNYTLLAPLHDGPIPLDWSEAEQIEINLRDLDSGPVEGAHYANFPDAASNARSYEDWKKLLNQFIRTNLSLKLLFSPALKTLSEPGEDERDFRIRLQHLAHERRDDAMEEIRKKYSSKLDQLEERHRRAKQAVEQKNAMAAQRKVEAAVSAGTALLGALLGRKTISATSVSRIGTAVRSTSRAFKSGQEISGAVETLQSIEAQIQELQLELEQQLEKISANYNMLEEKLESVEIRAISGNITVHFMGLAWVPKEK